MASLPARLQIPGSNAVVVDVDADSAHPPVLVEAWAGQGTMKRGALPNYDRTPR